MRSAPLLVALLVLGTASLPRSAPALPFGDLSCDGEMDVIDVVLAVRIAVNLPISPEMDANGNGLVDLCESYPTPKTCGAGTVESADGESCVLDAGYITALETAAFDDGVASVSWVDACGVPNGDESTCVVPAQLISDPHFDSATGTVCGVNASNSTNGPKNLGGGWYGFIQDTHANAYSCHNMCAGMADDSTTGCPQPVGYAGGTNGAGCNSWIYQCVTLPQFNAVQLSFKEKTYENWSGVTHKIIIRANCSTGPYGGTGWVPWSGSLLFESSDESTSWKSYSFDLTDELNGYGGETIFLGVRTSSAWSATYNPKTWIDDVLMEID